MYNIEFHKEALKDLKKLKKSNLLNKVLDLLDILKDDPWQEYPPYKKLTNNLEGFCSRRINVQHRLVYQVLEQEKIVRVLRMWSHYGDK